ncbi:MAG: MFS transporter, partial [Candidatus Paceibacterota bacterium]
AGFIESNSGLNSISIEVITSTESEIIEPIHPSQIELESEVGELRLITYQEVINISTVQRSRHYSDSVKSEVQKWNLQHGFYETEIESESEDIDVEENFWNNSIGWIEDLLKKYFGPEIIHQSDEIAGNVGIALIYLSNVPEEGEKIELNLGHENGDKSISLVEGERFIFTNENASQPAMALFQLDPKLDYASAATFTGHAGNIPLSWSITFLVLAGLFLIFFIYHNFKLPITATDKPVAQQEKNVLKEFLNTFALFFRKKQIGIILLFLLFYRFGEAQLVKLAAPFLLDAKEIGGLALTTGEVGFVYGTVGIIALTAGGILGGILASKHGLKFWLWPMIIAINLPNAVYIYLSYVMPESFLIINIAIIIEQFGYGFGFTAYMLYMIYISEGQYKTSHFAITTGFMALGMMIPGMFSGWIQDIIGYQNFFIWVLIATVPSFIIAYFVKIDPEFGKKKETE